MSKQDEDFILALLMLPVTLAVLTVQLAVTLLGRTFDLMKGAMDSPLNQEARAKELNRQLYERALSDFPRDKESFIEELSLRTNILPEAHALICEQIASAVWDFEGLEIPKPPPVANSIEGARYRDTLAKIKDIREPLQKLTEGLFAYAASIPEPGEGLSVRVRLANSITGQQLEDIINPIVEERDSFPKTMQVLEKNLYLMSGGTPEKTKVEDLVFPSDYKGKHSLGVYLQNTPLQMLMTTEVIQTIPIKNLFEHVHVLGSTGSGKTQLLQKMIIELLKFDGDCSIVVIDSQGDMLKNIINAAGLVDYKRLVMIDPTDVEYPLALNIFDIGQNTAHTSKADYERHMNGVVDLVTFVLSSILDSAATSKQSGLLKYLVRLLVYIPDANLLTLRKILQPKGLEPYRDFTKNLSQTAQNFFDKEFDDEKQYGTTKKEIGWRIDGLLESPTIERMFTSTETRFKLNEAMDTGKVVLINTAKDFLKREGSAFFGRFFISLIAQATQERATKQYRKNTFVIIDEAQDYLDSNVETLLQQARKYNVSITLAHQNFEQIPAGIRQAILSNTSTKFVGGASNQDARTLAPEMRTTSEFLASQPKLHFAMYSKGVTDTAMSVTVTAGELEDMDQRSEEYLAILKNLNRLQYAVVPENEDEDDDEELNEEDEVETEDNEDELADFKPAPEDPIPPQ